MPGAVPQGTPSHNYLACLPTQPHHPCAQLIPFARLTHPAAQLARLMKDNPDILLLKVEFDSNKTITKSLGIKVLPYFHFYRGTNGKVAAFSASLKKLDRLKVRQQGLSPSPPTVERPQAVPR